jgi:hypothetical protein
MTTWRRADDRKSEIVGDNARKHQRCLLEATKSGYDAMLNIFLNILLRAKEGERGERDSRSI